MGAIFTALFAKIAAVVQWFSDLFVAVFVALYDLVTDAVAWVFDETLGVAVDALGAVDMGGLSGYSNTWGSLPAEVLNVLGLLGVGTAVSIITAAIGVRLVLQMIPFTRLGS